MRIYVHDSSGGVLVSSVASRGTKKRRHKITGRSLVIDEAPGHAFHGNQWVEIAPGIHAPKSIANHPQFTKEKFLKYKEQGKTNAQISNILSAHKYHAEKKAGTHVPKKAAKASAPSEAAQTPPAAAEPAKEDRKSVV